jgi:predicted DNA-binding protein with PD1-like motif
LGGYGTLATYHLHWVKHNKLPSENLFRKGEGGIEILAMNGVIVDYEPHIHVALSTPEGAFGGHLEEGCEVYVLCEIYIGEVSGKTLSRGKRAVDIPGMGKGEVTALEL